MLETEIQENKKQVGSPPLKIKKEDNQHINTEDQII